MSIASLSDGKKTIKLTLPPETIERNISGTYASNNILDTSNPQVRRKFSASTLKLGRILLISPGLTVDQYPIVNTLTTWAKKQTRLNFQFNTYSVPICFMATCNINIKQWYKNRPVHVEIDIDLIEGYPDVTEKPKTPAKKITPREQAKAKAKVTDRLKTPAKLKSLGLYDDYAVEVSDISMVKFTSDGVEQEYDYDEFLRLTA